MIVDRNLNPERNLYYLGSILIDILSKSDMKEVDYIELYNLFNQEKEISMNLYSLALDWLYILGIVTKGKKGKIEKCF